MPNSENLPVDDLPGCVRRLVITETGQRVSLYHAEQLAMPGMLSLVLKETAGPWVTVCESHNSLAQHASQAEAEGQLLIPSTWCRRCAAAKVAQ